MLYIILYIFFLCWCKFIKYLFKNSLIKINFNNINNKKNKKQTKNIYIHIVYCIL